MYLHLLCTALDVDAAAASDSLTAADEADILALVALNMDMEQQIQQETAADAAAAGSKAHKQQGKVRVRRCAESCCDSI